MPRKDEVLTELPEPPFKRLPMKRLTKRQKEEIAYYYYTHNITQKDLAEMNGISPSACRTLLNDVKILKWVRDMIGKEMQKSEIRRSIALMRALESAPNAMEQIIKISSQDIETTPLQYQYIIQNAAHEVLDRAGIKPVLEENQNEIVVRFADPEGIFNPGMPDLENGKVEQDENSDTGTEIV